MQFFIDTLPSVTTGMYSKTNKMPSVDNFLGLYTALLFRLVP